MANTTKQARDKRGYELKTQGLGSSAIAETLNAEGFTNNWGRPIDPNWVARYFSPERMKAMRKTFDTERTVDVTPTTAVRNVVDVTTGDSWQKAMKWVANEVLTNDNVPLSADERLATFRRIARENNLLR